MQSLHFRILSQVEEKWKALLHVDAIKDHTPRRANPNRLDIVFDVEPNSLPLPLPLYYHRVS